MVVASAGPGSSPAARKNIAPAAVPANAGQPNCRRYSVA
jgi:hypothetical protein